MAAMTNALLSDEELIAKKDRLIRAAENPVASVGMGAQSVTLAPRNIEHQLHDVMVEMHNRGLVDLSAYLQTEVRLQSKDPRRSDQLLTVTQ